MSVEDIYALTIPTHLSIVENVKLSNLYNDSIGYARNLLNVLKTDNNEFTIFILFAFVRAQTRIAFIKRNPHLVYTYDKNFQTKLKEFRRNHPGYFLLIYRLLTGIEPIDEFNVLIFYNTLDLIKTNIKKVAPTIPNYQYKIPSTINYLVSLIDDKNIFKYHQQELNNLRKELKIEVH